ncbi:MAG: hypothetical protein WCI73_15890, partial [Phycisphaerae bacterium]
HVTGGTPVTLLGAITFAGAATISIDYGVTVTSNASMKCSSGSTLLLNGTLVMPTWPNAAARHANPVVSAV